MWAVSLLQAPYVAESVGSAEPRWGTIAIARLGASVEMLQPLHDYLETNPWCAPCVVVTPGSVSPETLQAIWSLPGQPGFVVATRGLAELRPTEIVRAIANRPKPTIPLLISYLVNRTGSPSLGQTVEQIWSPRPRGPRHAERTVRYRLRRMGGFGRHDWLRVLRLIQAKNNESAHTVERLAAAAGTEARTLRSWTECCLGISLRHFRQLAGWEWVLEAALRTAGLKATPEALEAAS